MNDLITCNDLYVIYYKGCGAMIRLSTRDTSADDFGDIQKRFCAESRRRDVSDRFCYAAMDCIRPENWLGGVPMHWELAGPDGASYVLYRFPHHTDAEIGAAESKIRRDRDVVRLRVEVIDREQDVSAYLVPARVWPDAAAQ